MMKRRIVLIAAFSTALSCGHPLRKGDAPSITLFTPEPASLAHHFLAVSGSATGQRIRVQVQIDDAPPLDADGSADWSRTVDLTTLAPGAHAVRGLVRDGFDRTAQTLPVSFICAFAQPANSHILAGAIRNDSTPLVGAAVSTVDGVVPATTSDATGRYALVGQPDALSAIVHGAASGFEDTYLYRVGSGDDFSLDVPMFAKSTIDAFASANGTTWSAGTGFVIGFVLGTSGGAATGATVSLAPPPPPGSGPFYLTSSGGFDASLTSLTSYGVFFAFDIPAPGPVTFTASHGGATFYVADSVAAPDSVSVLAGSQVPGGT